MDEEPKTNEESWAVEPLKKTASNKRKALRIALIVAAVGAAAATAVGVVGRMYKDDVSRERTPGDLILPIDPKDSGQEIGGDL